MPHARPRIATELEAFCATCPAAQEVTALLTQFGFRLEFQMDEQRDHSGQLPPLPAQYHYKDDAHGTEVIYLAGRDFPMNEDGHTLPPHASRFWLYPGADGQSYQIALSIVALSYQFTWRVPGQDVPHEEVAYMTNPYTPTRATRSTLIDESLAVEVVATGPFVSQGE